MTKTERVQQLPDGGVTETVRAIIQLEGTVAQTQAQMEDLAMALGPMLQELVKLKPALEGIQKMALQVEQINQRLAVLEQRLTFRPRSSPSKSLPVQR